MRTAAKYRQQADLLIITKPVAGAIGHLRIRYTTATVAAGIVTTFCDADTHFDADLNTDSSGTHHGRSVSSVQLHDSSVVEYRDGFFFQLELFNSFLFHVDGI
jgi:hypothetical protein